MHWHAATLHAGQVRVREPAASHLPLHDGRIICREAMQAFYVAERGIPGKQQMVVLHASSMADNLPGGCAEVDERYS